jgi:hypothetical protein
MQSTGGQADPTAEFTPDETQRRAGRRIGSGAWVTLLGCVVGGVIGLLAFWTDPQPEEAVGGDWTWAIPELSPEIGAAYRALFDTARDAVARLHAATQSAPAARGVFVMDLLLSNLREFPQFRWPVQPSFSAGRSGIGGSAPSSSGNSATLPGSSFMLLLFIPGVALR